MSYLQTALSKYTRAILSSCEENKCALKKPKEWTHDTLILKGEDLAKNIKNDTEKNIKMCDCIVFVLTNNDTLRVIIAELKSKTVHANELMEKLTNSGKLTMKIIEECKLNNFGMKIRFVVLAKRWDNTEKRVLLDKNKTIRIDGEKYNILAKRCGITIEDVINL